MLCFESKYRVVRAVAVAVFWIKLGRDMIPFFELSGQCSKSYRM